MELLTPSFGLIFWTLLAFVIVLFILGKYAWKPILNSLNQREKTIADSLETAERVKAEMAQLKSENEELMVRAREERGLMLKEARETKDKLLMKQKSRLRLKQTRLLSKHNNRSMHRKWLQLPMLKTRLENW